MATDAQGGGYPGIGASPNAPGSVAPKAPPISQTPVFPKPTQPNQTLPKLKTLKGKASIFAYAGASDDGQMANGQSPASAYDAISINIKHFYSNDGYDYLNGYWLAKSPNGKVAIHMQRDRGPNQAIPREFDFTPKAAAKHGYTGNFPTDEGEWTAVQVGRTPAAVTKIVGQLNASGSSLGNVIDALAGFDPLGTKGVGEDIGNSLVDAAGAVVGPVDALATAVTDVFNFFFGKDASSNWRRIGKVSIGVMALAIGLYALLSNTRAGTVLQEAAIGYASKGKAGRSLSTTAIRG